MSRTALAIEPCTPPTREALRAQAFGVLLELVRDLTTGALTPRKSTPALDAYLDEHRRQQQRRTRAPRRPRSGAVR